MGAMTPQWTQRKSNSPLTEATEAERRAVEQRAISYESPQSGSRATLRGTLRTMPSLRALAKVTSLGVQPSISQMRTQRSCMSSMSVTGALFAHEDEYEGVSQDGTTDGVDTNDRTSPVSPEPSCFSKWFGPQSTQGAVLKLSTAILGTGILAFPFALKLSGFVLGLCLLVLCTAFAYVSLNLLVIAAKHSTLEPDIDRSYMSLSIECGGPKLALFTQICVLISLLGSAVGRIIGFGQIMERLHVEIYPEPIDDFYVYFVLCVSLTVVFPLSLLRNMSSLRFTSLLSVSCSLFLTVVLLTQFLASSPLSRMSLDREHLASFEIKNIFLTLPFFIYGYNCQPNIFPIYKELGTAEKKPMQKVIISGVGVGFCSYVVAAASGFLLFLDECEDNILLNDFNGAPELVVVQVLFTLAMILAVPIFVNVMRRNVLNLLSGQGSVKSRLKHVLVTALILSVNVAIAIAVPNFSDVFGFIGSTVNPITGYVLPTYFVWTILRKRAQHDVKLKCIRYGALVMAVIVELMCLTSFAFKIIDTL